MEGDIARQKFARDPEINGPIDAEYAGAAKGLIGKLGRSAFGIENDRKPLGQRCNNRANPTEGGGFVILASENSAPRVKNLNRINARADLHFKIIDERRR